jgi:hypothetical protein
LNMQMSKSPIISGYESVLLVEETGIHGEKHRSIASN